jgi:hypothetical protein
MIRNGLVVMLLVMSFPQLLHGYLKGNLNLNYQKRSSNAGQTSVSSFSQVMNLNLFDRLFYANDMMLGTSLFRTRSSANDHDDFRVRYILSLSGNRYTIYSSYSPYNLYRLDAPAYHFKVFQTSLNYQPRMLPNVVANYTSNKQFTKDTPQSVDASTNTWNLATGLDKKFGSIRGSYQQILNKTNVGIRQQRVQKSLNLGYEISGQAPGKIDISAGYGFNGYRTNLNEERTFENFTHSGAIQASRGFGRWFSLNSAFSSKRSDITQKSGNSNTRDFLGNLSGIVNLRPNLSLSLFRGYSSSKTTDGTSTESISDYLNLSASYGFILRHNSNGNISIGRSIYYKSPQGHTSVNNATLLFDVDLYRQVEANVTIGISQNEGVQVGGNRYQTTKLVNIIARPLEAMSFTVNYQASLASTRVDFTNANSEDISMNITHQPKPYFNYTVSYTQSVIGGTRAQRPTTLSTTFNWRLSSSLSILANYARRTQTEAFQSAGAQIGWSVSRRSTLSVNYNISNINSIDETKSIGGYYILNF